MIHLSCRCGTDLVSAPNRPESVLLSLSDAIEAKVEAENDLPHQFSTTAALPPCTPGYRLILVDPVRSALPAQQSEEIVQPLYARGGPVACE
jgi:hypothetical protein